jgi:DNA-directed RNA polymerase specialized sigma24 family protein
MVYRSSETSFGEATQNAVAKAWQSLRHVDWFEVTEMLELVEKDKVPFRMGIVLVDIGELTHEEACKVMSCPIGTVRSRVSRGRMILQVELRDYTLELEQGLTVPGTPPESAA